jgi:hypothetical protein
MREQQPVDGYSEKGNGLGPVSPNFPLERRHSCLVFSRMQLINPDATPSNDIRQSKMPFGKSPIFFMGEWFVHEAGFEEELPKAVGRSRKMMSHARGADSWIDADKQDAGPRPHIVWEVSWVSRYGRHPAP